MAADKGLLLVIFAGLVAGMAGCAVGPEYRRPEVATPEAYQSLPRGREDAPMSQPQPAQAELTRWWQQFQDPELQRLIEQALRENLDLQSAASQIRQAREQEVIAGGNRLPGISATGSAVRLHSKTNPLGGLNGGGSGGGQSGNTQPGGSSNSGSSAANSPFTLNLYSLGFDASWEIDLFGGVARGVEAARANTAAATWQLRDAQVSLCAEVADAYLTLRTTQARIGIVRESTGHQQQLLDLVQARARTGFVTELDVNQQRTQLAATQAELPMLEAQERATIHALDVLLGKQPEEMASELTTAAPVPTIPATLPMGLPSDLLRRRPDVRRAERQLAAATAQVGVAVANLYPKFNLIGLASLASNSAGKVLNSRNGSEAAAGLISWPVFQGGRLGANVRASKEQQAQTYLAYRRSVLAALQDAEDSLTRYTADQRRLLTLQESESAAGASLHIAEEQYRTGLVPFINVLTATASVLNARDQVAQSRQALAQDLVAVYKALGGGWQDNGAD